MYAYLLIFHSIFRWLVLLSLVYAMVRGLQGWKKQLIFTKADDTIRHITATIAHVQLTLGYLLYFNSPVIAYFRSNYREAVKQFDFVFFGMLHITLMTLAIILISVGSSMAKRKEADRDKFRTITLFYGLALLIIFLAIPWPFSPLASRPLFRPF